MQGQLEEARGYINGAWDYIAQHGLLGMSGLGRVILSCAETYDALGDTEKLGAVIEKGHTELMKAAGDIGVPEFRQSFLENVPGNRAITEMWERRQRA